MRSLAGSKVLGTLRWPLPALYNQRRGAGPDPHRQGEVFGLDKGSLEGWKDGAGLRCCDTPSTDQNSLPHFQSTRWPAHHRKEGLLLQTREKSHRGIKGHWLLCLRRSSTKGNVSFQEEYRNFCSLIKARQEQRKARIRESV